MTPLSPPRAIDVRDTAPQKWAPIRFCMSAEDAIKFAKVIRDHQHFCYLLCRCEPEDRQIMYEALRPHLKFKALDLDSYRAMAAKAADNQKLPVFDADGKLTAYEDYNPGRKPLERLAEKAVADALAMAASGGYKLRVICSKCTSEAEFTGDTQVGATIKARKAGWVYDFRFDKEICPKCPAVRSN